MSDKSKVVLPSAWFATDPFRVRYQESDQMGVVYHANYLSWFESGRTEMLRKLGFDYRSLEEQGVLLPVTEANLQFKSPARYDDLIAVHARLAVFSPLRVVYEYEVRRMRQDGNEDSPAGQPLVTGSTSHVWVNRDFKPVRLDRVLPELYGAITGALR